MKNILITGGAGFIGSHIAEFCAQQGHAVRILDNLSTGYQKTADWLKKQYPIDIRIGDILNQEDTQSALNDIDTVFHLAARISVAESMEQPLAYIETNTQGTIKLLEQCAQLGVKNFVLSSSAAVYGNNPINPKTEDMCPEPLSAYAISKLDGEYYCQVAREQYGINATALRYFNVFGPRQDPNSAYAAAIPIFIKRALNNQPITLFGTGEQTRDFVSVYDVVKANCLAAEIGGNIFNVASASSMTILELAKKIIAITGSNSRIELAPARAGDILHSQASHAKITDKLGFIPDPNFDTALKKTIHSFKASESIHD